MDVDKYHLHSCETFEDPESACDCGLILSVEEYAHNTVINMHSYWNVLKNKGLTQKQFIKEFDTYLRKEVYE